MVCKSANQMKFPSELVIHFPGLENLARPQVIAFPNILVCMDCGSSWFAVADLELRLLQEGDHLGFTTEMPGCRTCGGCQIPLDDRELLIRALDHKPMDRILADGPANLASEFLQTRHGSSGERRLAKPSRNATAATAESGPHIEKLSQIELRFDSHDVRDNADMFRTRFMEQIVAEFLPPSRPRKIQKLIILCDGMPSIPRKQSLSEFLAAKGFWVIYPRYRGAWESDGHFLEKSPHEDILNIIDDLPREIEEIAFGRRFRLSPDQVFIIGGSFGGAAAILVSLDPRVQRVIANCPVVDWSILGDAEKAETSKANYAEYIREAFGNGYRLSDAKWEKLRSGTFYNPWHHRDEITASKVMLFHAKDDPHVPYKGSEQFAKLTGVTLKSLRRGGHVSTDYIVRKYWPQIKKFFDSAGIPVR
jgi:pimeloyl-ACP methyl ester carboxylesterase